MIVGWSAHTGATTEGGLRAAINYLLAANIDKMLGGERIPVLRDPAPELLIGDPEASFVTLQALRSKHRYSVVTLSFAKDDIDVNRFNLGDRSLRNDIARTLSLFFEVAYFGLPRSARLRPLVCTQTHTGRLEVNILMPRAVLRSDGRVMAYNPRPPGKVSRDLWDQFRDTANHHFGWADPLAFERRLMVKAPNWVIKADREVERHHIDAPR